MRTDRQADRHDVANYYSSQFANAPKELDAGVP